VARRTPIAEMQANQLIEGIYAIQNCQLGMTKGGKPYLKCLLADRTGRTPGRMWNASEDLINHLPTNGFVNVEGQTQPYQGEMQIIIQHISPARPTNDDLQDLLPSTSKNVTQMFDQVKKILDTIADPALKTLLGQYLKDDQLMDLFRKAPAAMTLHHAYIGGLLEHTLSLLQLADVFCPLYPKLNRDLIMVGLFIHDLGKCSELTWEQGFGYSDDGQLVGHVARGVIWLEKKAEQCAAQNNAISDSLLSVLHHMILSHHGKLEFGALKIPATPEAIAINLLDNMDAKLQMAIDAVRENDTAVQLGGNFTEKIWALETRLYRPDPTSSENELTGA